jgi:putative SOS response-associated peptidase YedK
VLAFAGIYEIGETNQKSAAIITQPATQVVAAVHDRMPLILTPEFFDAWLDPSQTDRQLAVAVAATAKSPSLSSHPVSAAVNAASAQGPQLIEPSPPEPTQPALFQ